MAESFLEEQLKRIKEMTERMSRVRPFDEHEVRSYIADDRSSAPDRATTVPDKTKRAPRHSRPSPRRRGR